jgi:hypothetical protein
MKKVLIAIFILSIIDAIATYTGVKLGIVEEANPLLTTVFHSSPELAAVLLIAFIGAMLWVINRYGHRLRHINVGLAMMLMVKLAIIGAHVGWIRMVV